MIDLSPDTVLHVLTSVVMVVFAIGAWRARRESAEMMTGANVRRLEKDLQETRVSIAGGLSDRPTWHDFERERETIRREVSLQLDPVTARLVRIEKRIWNGGEE